MTPRAVLVALAAALAVGSAALLEHRRTLRQEIETMRVASANAAELADDARLVAEVERIRFALEQARSQPARNAEAHLALEIGDGVLTLERGDIIFRSATVEADVKRGVHSVEQVEERSIVLSGGIRLRPVVASDTSALAPGEIRVRRADFFAILPNVRPGQTAYLF